MGIKEIREAIKKNKDYGDYCFLGDELLERIKNFPVKYDTFLWYSPKDKRACFFDFSYLNENKIMLFDGFNPRDKVYNDLTVEDFLKTYKDNLFFSITHWEVNWTF